MKGFEKRESRLVYSNEDQGEDINFGISEDGVDKAIALARENIYSDPLRIVCQEYLANARDAHREANKEDIPVKVTLPNEQNMVFKVRDFGKGLSKKEMAEVFIKYFASTKRSDSGLNGGFGIGAKSGYAYADYFYVVSYQKGEATRYLAHKENSPRGNLRSYRPFKTDEPEGLEIVIPVKKGDIERFWEHFCRTTFFWKTRPVVEGIDARELPAGYSDYEIMYRGKSAAVVRSLLSGIPDVDRKANLVVDGIIYPLGEELTEKMESFKKIAQIPVYKGSGEIKDTLFFFVGNDEVSVPANREQIGNTPKTRARLKKLYGQAWSELASEIREKLKREKGLKNKARAFAKMRQRIVIPAQKARHGGAEFILENGGIYPAAKKGKRKENIAVNYRPETRGDGVKMLTGSWGGIPNFAGENIAVVLDEDESQSTLKKRLRHLFFDISRENPLDVICHLRTDKLDAKQIKAICEAFGAVRTGDIIPKKQRKKGTRSKSPGRRAIHVKTIKNTSVRLGWREHLIKGVSHETVEFRPENFDRKKPVYFIEMEKGKLPFGLAIFHCYLKKMGEGKQYLPASKSALDAIRKSEHGLKLVDFEKEVKKRRLDSLSDRQIGNIVAKRVLEEVCGEDFWKSDLLEGIGCELVERYREEVKRQLKAKNKRLDLSRVEQSAFFAEYEAAKREGARLAKEMRKTMNKIKAKYPLYDMDYLNGISGKKAEHLALYLRAVAFSDKKPGRAKVKSRGKKEAA